MSIPTCSVRAVVLDSVGGVPISGAQVSARLSSYEIYQGFVVPELIELTTDANGAVTMPLFPNELGSASSFYNIKIVAKGKSLRSVAVVPNLTAVDLADICEIPPYDGKPESAVFIANVISARAQALQFRNEAEGFSQAAEQSNVESTQRAAEAVAAAAVAGTSSTDAQVSKQAAKVSEVLSLAAASSALEYSEIAELGATSATVAGKVYPTPAAGVMAGTGVPPGAFFGVRSSLTDVYVEEYENVAGSPVATGKTYPSGRAVYDFEVASTTALIRLAAIVIENHAFS